MQLGRIHLFSFASFLLVPFWLQARSQATGIWGEIKPTPSRSGIAITEISETAKARIRRVLAEQGMQHTWECPLGDPDADWLRNLRFSAVDLDREQTVLLVEAGAGCARGGQGSNGAMWLLRLGRGQEISILADPDHDFSGWVYEVAQTESHSYRDVVIGWHLGSAESTLIYFRFDGHRYQAIGKATAHFEDNSHVTIMPQPSQQP